MYRVGDVFEQCDVCRSCDKFPRAPLAETTTVSMFDEKLQVDLSVLDDSVAFRAMDVSFKYSLFFPVRSRNPEEVRDACRGARIGVFGQS